MGRWNCSRCGVCCKATWLITGGNTFGLYLEPSEIERFPKEAVFPLFGRGRNPIEVTAYQLGVPRCPNYEETAGVGRCAIYPDRPKACAAFPVITPTHASLACPGIARIKDGIEADSLAAELAARRKSDDRMLDMRNEWVWPLNRRCWVPLTYLAEPQNPQEPNIAVKPQAFSR